MTVTAAQPRLRVFAGPNGSGKSTIQALLAPEWIGAYVNADDIEKKLRASGELPLAGYALNAAPEILLERFTGHLASSRLLQNHQLADVAGHCAITGDATVQIPPARINSYVAAVLADAIRRELLRQGSTFTFETVMSSPDKIRFMREAQAQGYRTYLYFVATDDPAINIERVRLRVLQGGHPVPEDKIRSRYLRSIGLLDEACTVSNRAYIFDNSGEAQQLIAEVTDGDRLHPHAEVLPAWFVKTTLWQSFH